MCAGLSRDGCRYSTRSAMLLSARGLAALGDRQASPAGMNVLVAVRWYTDDLLVRDDAASATFPCEQSKYAACSGGRYHGKQRQSAESTQ